MLPSYPGAPRNSQLWEKFFKCNLDTIHGPVVKNKNIDTKLAIFVSIGGALGAIIGANISVNIGVQKLRRLFGIFLVIIVIHEIYTLFKEYKMSKKSNTKFS